MLWRFKSEIFPSVECAQATDKDRVIFSFFVLPDGGSVGFYQPKNEPC